MIKGRVEQDLEELVNSKKYLVSADDMKTFSWRIRLAKNEGVDLLEQAIIAIRRQYSEIHESVLETGNTSFY